MGRNPSKAKGSRFENQVAARIGGKRTPLSGSAGGGDVTPPRSGPWSGFHIECKKRKNLAVDSWMAQAIRACDEDQTPLVVISRDRGEMLAVLRMDDLARLLGEQEQVA